MTLLLQQPLFLFYALYSDPQKYNSIFFCGFPYFFRPERHLYLTDVGFAQVEHADTGLSDAAADGIGQFLIQNGFLEGKVCPLLAACQLQLTGKGLLVTADSVHVGVEAFADVEAVLY